MSLAQGFPSTFSDTQTTTEVLHNLDNETKKIYNNINSFMAAGGHGHSGNGSDGAKIKYYNIEGTPTIENIDDSIVSLTSIWSSKKTKDQISDGIVSATETAVSATTASANAAAASANAANLAAQSIANFAFTTKALMDADLAHAANVTALVTNDPANSPTNQINGIYIKIGESGTGSWEKSKYVPPVTDWSITTNKRTALGEMAMLISTGGVPNFITTEPARIFIPKDIVVTHRNLKYVISADVTIDYSAIRNSVTTTYIYFNIDTKTFICRNSAGLTGLTENHILFAVVPYDISVGKPTLIGTYTINGVSVIADNSVMARKRTLLGEIAMLFSTSGFPDFVTNLARLSIPGSVVITWRNQKYTIATDVTIDYSAIRAQGTTAYVYFDASNKTFAAYTSSGLTTLSEDNLLIAVIPYDIDKTSPVMIGAYTVNGCFTNYNSFETYYPPVIPAADGTGTFNYSTDKAADVYAKYDELVTLYPAFVEKVDMGYDQSGLIPIYSYVFRPGYVSEPAPTTPMKIILGAGIHGPSGDGDNKVSVYALYWFLRDVCARWKTNDFLAYLRWNVRIVVIPVQNPWGFNNNSRYNSQNVDINRNFDCNWENFVDAHKGSAAFSERESQVIKSVIENNSDAVYYGDIHSRGGSDAISNNNLALYVGAEAGNSRYFGQNTIGKITYLWDGKYGLTTKPYGGVALYKDRPSSYTWAAQVMNMDAANPEGFAQFGSYTSHSQEVMTMNTQYIGNLINAVVKWFQAKPKI